MIRSTAYRSVRLIIVTLLFGTPAFGQDPSPETPATRTEAIVAARADKVAELWPERQEAMVDLVDARRRFR